MVLIALVLIIIFIIWWFFGKRTTKSVAATRQGNKQVVEIVVDGGFSPKVVVLERDVPADIIFTRRDASACFEEVVLPDFGTRAHLPIGKAYTITVTPHVAGEYQYTCGMNMFFGKVVVK